MAPSSQLLGYLLVEPLLQINQPLSSYTQCLEDIKRPVILISNKLSYILWRLTEKNYDFIWTHPTIWWGLQLQPPCSPFPDIETQTNSLLHKANLNQYKSCLMCTNTLFSVCDIVCFGETGHTFLVIVHIDSWRIQSLLRIHPKLQHVQQNLNTRATSVINTFDSYWP